MTHKLKPAEVRANEVLGYLEHRGFYDAEKYLGGGVAEVFTQDRAETLKAIEGVLEEKMYRECMKDSPASHINKALQDLKEDINRLFTE